MTEFIVPQTSNATQNQSVPQDRIRRWVWKLCIATLILMAIGSATRVMNAGLACPDWPLCYGTLVPRAQMNLQVFLEWFPRLAALGGYFCLGSNCFSRRTWRLNRHAIATF